MALRRAPSSGNNARENAGSRRLLPGPQRLQWRCSCGFRLTTNQAAIRLAKNAARGSQAAPQRRHRVGRGPPTRRALQGRRSSSRPWARHQWAVAPVERIGSSRPHGCEPRKGKPDARRPQAGWPRSSRQLRRLRQQRAICSGDQQARWVDARSSPDATRSAFGRLPRERAIKLVIGLNWARFPSDTRSLYRTEPNVRALHSGSRGTRATSVGARARSRGFQRSQSRWAPR